MKNGKWCLKFNIRIEGETNFGDSVDLNHEVQLPLYATDDFNAEKNAAIVVMDITRAIDAEDKEFFKQYHGAIEDEDGVSVSDFRICSEKPLDVPDLSIIAGP